MIAALIRSVLQSGWASVSKAAEPAVIGEAWDVPEMVAALKPVPTPADSTATPGAVTSGLIALSPLRGPPEVNDASRWEPGVLIWVCVSVAVPPSAASRVVVTAAVPGAPKNGIVTWNGTPVSGFSVISPSIGGEGASGLFMRTGAGAACSPAD